MTVTNQVATIAGNLSYVGVLLWLVDYNGYSIDRLRIMAGKRKESEAFDGLKQSGTCASYCAAE